MVMIDHSADRTLLFARNGANRPLHQDRQVLRAGDLTLEQATQDAMLARARRYLHGWGVVAGFVPGVKKELLIVGPGYGVTPFGDELFMPEDVTLPGAAVAVVRCCGPDAVGCEIVDKDKLAEAKALAGGATIAAFLIARPASRDAAPRPGVPEDCAHPAATLLPSRRCGGVEFAILCTLPTSHQPHPRDCDALMPFVCGAARGAIQPLPWENPLGPDSNFLVIAELSVTGHALTATVGARRTLWPVALMQEWIASCLCPLIDKPDKPPVILPGHVDSPPPPPGGHIEEIKPPDAFIVQPPPVQAPDIGVNKAAESNLKLAIDPQPSPQNAAPDLRAQLTGPVTDIAGVGPARAQQLAAIGVVTEGDFMSAAPDQLAKTMNLAADKIAEMKQDVSTRNNLKPAVG